MKCKILFLLMFFSFLFTFGCIQEPEAPECIFDANCSDNEYCSNEECVELEADCGYAEEHEWVSYECCFDAECGPNYECSDNECVQKEGCNYDNPICMANQECVNNECVLKEGCDYDNPHCPLGQTCLDNICTCNSNSDCTKSQACINNLCEEVECKEDLDCSIPSTECLNYNCKSRGNCSLNEDCDYDEVCVDKKCSKMTDCTSGSCEDDYFKLKDVVFEDTGNQYVLTATITAKTETKGKFGILWNEKGNYGYSKSVEMEYKEEDEDLRLWISMDPPNYKVEHFLIEHTSEPNLLYLVIQFEEIE